MEVRNMPFLAPCFRDRGYRHRCWRLRNLSTLYALHGDPRQIHLRPPPVVSASDDLCWDTHGGRARRNIIQDDCIGTDLGVLSDLQFTDDLSACAHIDVAFQGRYTAGLLANRDLLKKQTIGPNLGSGMNHDTVRMRQEQAAPQFAVQWNIGTRDYRPPAVPEYRDPAQPIGAYPSSNLADADSREMLSKRERDGAHSKVAFSLPNQSATSADTARARRECRTHWAFGNAGSLMPVKFIPLRTVVHTIGDKESVRINQRWSHYTCIGGGRLWAVVSTTRAQ